jgi:hypothetical protein
VVTELASHPERTPRHPLLNPEPAAADVLRADLPKPSVAVGSGFNEPPPVLAFVEGPRFLV